MEAAQLPTIEVPTSLKECWDIYNRDNTAPDSWLNWAWYYLISAALQRRVWIGAEDNRPLYSNIYFVPVGPPAVGKGLVIEPVQQILSYWKLPRPGQITHNGEISPEKMIQEAAAQAAIGNDPELLAAFEKKRKRMMEEKLVIPIGANATTFESLAETIAESVRRINYNKINPLTGKNYEPPPTYTHCSLAFLLTELSSLFKRQSENVVNLLTDLYDCKPYTYKTKTKGTDHIAKGCICFMAGTTFSYMEEIFSSRIINEGFASRTFFVVESSPRFYKWDISKLDDLQRACKMAIINYVKRLSCVYGECYFSPDADKLLQDWWENKHGKGGERINHDPKLEYYYGRKNIHVKKLCMCHHFSRYPFLDSTDNTKVNFEISLDTAEFVLEMLGKSERKMHQALSFTSSNPLYKASAKLIRILSKFTQGLTYQQVQVEMWEHCDIRNDLKPILEYLEMTEQIERDANPDELKREQGLVYKLKMNKLEEGVTK